MKMRKQRLMGLVLVAIAALVVAIASTGETVEDRDATAALIIGPLGLYMVFTKDYVLYDGEAEEPEAKARDRPGARRRSAGATPLPARENTIYTAARKELQHGKNASN